MKILFATSECVPFVKTGGLADVAGALPKALKAKGEDVRVILPLYGSVTEEQRAEMKYLLNFDVAVAWRRQYCGVFEAEADGVTYYLLDNEYYFKRSGLYGYYDDAERLAFFSRAVLDTVKHLEELDGFIEDNCKAMGVEVTGKAMFSNIDELSPNLVAQAFGLNTVCGEKLEANAKFCPNCGTRQG